MFLCEFMLQSILIVELGSNSPKIFHIFICARVDTTALLSTLYQSFSHKVLIHFKAERRDTVATTIFSKLNLQISTKIDPSWAFFFHNI